MTRAICPWPCAGSRRRGEAKSRRMPAAAGRANWGARFTRNCAGRAHWQEVPGRAPHPAAPRHLRASRRLAATERRRLFAPCDGASSSAPVRGHVRAAPRRLRSQRLGACGPARARLRAPRHRSTCARRCRALRRRLGPTRNLKKIRWNLDGI